MGLKRFLVGMLFLTIFIGFGVSFSAKNFNKEMGGPAAVVFSYEEVNLTEELPAKHRVVILGQEFYILQAQVDSLRSTFKRSYLYWKEWILGKGFHFDG